jgi:UDP-sulfoquinovose synthase
VNLAQQPSAPYSHKSRSHAADTTTGNLIGTLNVLYTMHDICPNAHLIQIGSMGEYDPSTELDIPEGIFDLKVGKKTARNVIFPRRPGSWYHSSKVASTYYIDCACRWWGLKATDIMQGIVYGGWTPEIQKLKSYTRLDSDEAFGTVVHRFVVQAVIGSPLTIYGKGLHKRGLLALNDSIQCLMLAIENVPAKGEYRTWNQLDTVHSMNDIADIVVKAANEYDVGVEKLYIKSPRAENIADHYYNPVVKKLKKLGFKPTRKMEDEIRFLLSIMLDNIDKLKKLSDVVMPKIMWG